MYVRVLMCVPDEALKGQLADQEFGRLLILADLAQSDRARSIAVGRLYTSGSRCRLASSLCLEALARGLWGLVSVFASRLLCAGHRGVEWRRSRLQHVRDDTTQSDE
jgi:hypothetical protein